MLPETAWNRLPETHFDELAAPAGRNEILLDVAA